MKHASRILFGTLISLAVIFAAPAPSDISTAMRAKVMPLTVGMNRLSGAHEITGVPNELIGKPVIICDRGDGTKPSPAWSFSLPGRARVYMSVLRRGAVTVPKIWEKTGIVIEWRSKDGAQFLDDVYTRIADAGTVDIPGHDGAEGPTHGVPHLIIIDDADAPIPPASALPSAAKKTGPVSLWIEAESFPLMGGWTTLNDTGATCLVGGSDENPKPREKAAVTVIAIPESGTYKLWVRSKDYATVKTATRRFTVAIDGKQSEKEFGTHRQEGWAWTDGGTFTLTKGDAIIALLDTAAFYGRCDKMLLTTDMKYAPSGNGARENIDHKTPERACDFNNADLVYKSMPSAQGKEVCRMENGQYRLVFQSFDAGGETVIAPAVQTKDGVLSEARHNYFVYLFNPENGAVYDGRRSHFPYFTTQVTLRTKAEEWTGPAQVQNPFISSPVKVYFYGSSVISRDAKKVVLRKETRYFAADITYTFENDVPFVTVTLTPKENGFATCGAFAFAPVTQDDCSYFLLPYYYQARRFPNEISITPSCTATAPLSLMETKKSGAAMTFALAANLKEEEFGWLTYERSFAAFSIYNEKKQIQPGIFAPVPGTSRYAAAAGKPFTFSFSMYAAKRTWNESFGDIALNVFKVTDIRKNFRGTVYDAAANMMDLLMNDAATGWNARHKGFVQIENKNTVSQSSLLTLLEMYYLTGDERIYDERVVPTSAFLFSRGSQHFPTHPTDYGLTYIKKVDLDGPVKLYGTSTYHGFHTMFRGRNPVFFADALNRDGSAKLNNGYNTIPLWSEQLYAYYLTGDRKYLDESIAGCKSYIEKNVHTPPTDSRNYNSFIKLAIPQYFWALVDMYEETKDSAVLEAAKVAADTLLTTLYIHPYPFQPTYDVKRKDNIEFSRPVGWWNDSTFFRLGFDLSSATLLPGHHVPVLSPMENYLKNPNDILEETVPAWVVSPLGVSIEQPYTIARAYTLSNHVNTETPLFPIRQNCEVAYLMRLYGLTKEKRYWVYARNGILGQFMNYPGYYINLMSTTERAADYPLKGPDLSDIYYHHIPVHLGFTIDFLFTSAEVRSGGKVKFPTTLQQGYVWFINRMYGHEAGSFYGDSAFPILKKGLITLSSDACNYVTAYGKNAFHVFLMNEEDKPVQMTVSLADGLITAGKDAPVKVISDNGPQSIAAMKNGSVTVTVSPQGVCALSFPNTKVAGMIDLSAHAKKPANDAASFIRETDSGFGGRVQAALIAHPINDHYDAFINTDMLEGELGIKYSSGGADEITSVTSFPYETTIRVKDVSKSFTFTLKRTDKNGVKRSKTYTLRFTMK